MFQREQILMILIFNHEEVNEGPLGFLLLIIIFLRRNYLTKYYNLNL